MYTRKSIFFYNTMSLAFFFNTTRNDSSSLIVGQFLLFFIICQKTRSKCDFPGAKVVCLFFKICVFVLSLLFFYFCSCEHTRWAVFHVNSVSFVFLNFISLHELTSPGVCAFFVSLHNTQNVKVVTSHKINIKSITVLKKSFTKQLQNHEPHCLN